MQRSINDNFILRPEPRVTEIYEVYRRIADIYGRTNAAMGRKPTYQVTMSTTKGVKVTNG